MHNLDNFLKKITNAVRSSSPELRLSIRECELIKSEIEQLKIAAAVPKAPIEPVVVTKPVPLVVSINGGKFN